MLTYSINLGTPLETTSYPLTNLLSGTASTFDILLDKIYDNESKIIKPRELRDFILSVNSSIVFKSTSNSNGEFIGFDKGYPNDPDLKGYKILIGNKLYNDNSPLLTEDNISFVDDDIILSKTDNLEKTKIGFITNSDKIPYIETAIDFNIMNDDSININSSLDRVNINDIALPSISENIDIDGKYLVYQTDKLVWEKQNIEITDNIISNEETIIEGDLLLNNFLLEFKDNRKIPINIGDIKKANSFSNKISISEVIKRVIYTYLPPEINIEFINTQYNAIEVGSVIYPKVKYTINKKTFPVDVSFINLNPSFIAPITTNNYETKTGILEVIISNPIPNSTHSFIGNLNDGQTIIQKELLLDIVYPIFYGFSPNNITDLSFLSNLNKLVIKKSNTQLDIQGTGIFYFIFPHSYGLLNSVNGTLPIANISSYFFNSPELYWQNIRYYVYRFNNVNITQQENISFVF